MQLAAKEMDNLMWNMLEKAADISIPRIDEGRGVECCPAPPVRRLQSKSYQEWMTRTPVRLGGMGMRSVLETSLLAYIEGVEQALPNFVGEGGVCQQLTAVLGDMSNMSTRWQQLLTNGSRTGEELAWAWETLRQEAMESCQFLGIDLDGLLVREVEGAGDGSTDGSTRRTLTKWIEDARNKVLAKALESKTSSGSSSVG